MADRQPLRELGVRSLRNVAPMDNLRPPPMENGVAAEFGVDEYSIANIERGMQKLMSLDI